MFGAAGGGGGTAVGTTVTVGGVTLYELAAWCACPNAEAQLEFSVEFGRLDDPEFCSSAVEFLVAALDGTNPGFAWLGADGPATEETNLDWLLHRRVRDSVRGARSLLRGYSWTTVCPEELSQKLGGPAARRDGGLPRGLPACCGRSRAAGDQDVEEYSDDAVRRVFEALHPVLPPEMPQFDPAHPELRYFAADASLEPIKDPISGKALVIGVKRALWRPVPSRQPQREVSRRADRGDGPAFRPPPAAQQAAGPGPGRAGG